MSRTSPGSSRPPAFGAGMPWPVSSACSRATSRAAHRVPAGRCRPAITGWSEQRGPGRRRRAGRVGGPGRRSPRRRRRARGGQPIAGRSRRGHRPRTRLRRRSAATAKESRRVLRSALSAAWQDELIVRNVSTLVPPPRGTSREIKPWTLDQTLTFLSAARTDPLCAAFVLAIALGMRRGEIVALRWSWVNLENRVLWVGRQLQRVGGKLYEDTTKSSKRRPVPLPRICASALRWHRMRQDEARRAADRVRLHHPHQPADRADQPIPLIRPGVQGRRGPGHPAAQHPARVRDAARRLRGTAAGGDGDPRQHGPAAQAAPLMSV